MDTASVWLSFKAFSDHYRALLGCAHGLCARVCGTCKVTKKESGELVRLWETTAGLWCQKEAQRIRRP